MCLRRSTSQMVYGLRSYSIGRHGWVSARTLLLWGPRLVAAATSKAIVLALRILHRRCWSNPLSPAKIRNPDHRAGPELPVARLAHRHRVCPVGATGAGDRGTSSRWPNTAPRHAPVEAVPLF